MSSPACPYTGTRLVLVTGTNGQGDQIRRWECPDGDWNGSWFTGLETDEIHQIPEVTRTTGNARNLELARRFGNTGRTTTAITVTVSGNTTLVTPPLGRRIRLLWLGMSSSQLNGDETLVSVRFGSGTPFYRWFMGNPGAFSHWEAVEGGTDDPLVATLSASYTVQVNLTYETI